MARSGKGGTRPTYGSGRRVGTGGYVYLWRPGHPLAHADGYVPEHRLVLWEAGVEVPADHHVHHVNGDRQDNRRANLEVLAPGEHHARHHQPGATVRNQHGVYPILPPEDRLERRRAHARRYQRRLRVARWAARAA